MDCINVAAATSFSPVAGIQWVETRTTGRILWRSQGVSVPLPGFSGLRQVWGLSKADKNGRFSPVAGIQWVETRSI